MKNLVSQRKVLLNKHGHYEVIGLPAFADNFIWLIKENNSPAKFVPICVVDPGCSSVVIEYCSVNNLVPQNILLTHHHADHTGGVGEILTWMGREHPNVAVTVYGPALEDIYTVNKPVGEADFISIKNSLVINVLFVPGHTRGHVAYYIPSQNCFDPPALFSGDVVFGLGCGRLFEGTAEQMYIALQKIAKLEKNTKIYCAHEYTALNLPFALEVNPTNADLLTRAREINFALTEGGTTVPLTLSEELNTNPFFLNNSSADLESAVGIFAELRNKRDNFK